MRTLILFAWAMFAGVALASASPLVIEPQTLNLGKAFEGETAHGSLILRNTGSVPLSIMDVQASCGCTTGVPDSRLLPPGGFTELHVSIDTSAKRGRIRKQIWVNDDAGHTASAELRLTVAANPHRRMGGRSIFDGRCAACHAAPAAGLTEGPRIYAAVCAMCHGADARGAYAPSLRGRGDAAALARRIGEGAGNVYMPGFAKVHGGPLSASQLQALGHWLASLR